MLSPANFPFCWSGCWPCWCDISSSWSLCRSSGSRWFEWLWGKKELRLTFPSVSTTWYSKAGVSISSKNLVFYKGWYLRFEFFISRVNVVFYKKRWFFIKGRIFIKLNNSWSEWAQSAIKLHAKWIKLCLFRALYVVVRCIIVLTGLWYVTIVSQLGFL